MAKKEIPSNPNTKNTIELLVKAHSGDVADYTENAAIDISDDFYAAGARCLWDATAILSHSGTYGDSGTYDNPGPTMCKFIIIPEEYNEVEVGVINLLEASIVNAKQLEALEKMVHKLFADKTSALWERTRR